MTKEQLKKTFLNLLRESAQYQMLPMPDMVVLYLSNLLYSISGPNYIETFDPSKKLADIYIKAAESKARSVRAIRYKEIGDTTLVRLGLFPESLKKEVVSKGYYKEMGTVAYEQVYMTRKDPVYMGLYESYDNCINMLHGVKMLSCKDDIIALYDFWEDTGSIFAKNKLFKLGMMVDKKCQD